jgi:hypothetical protein
MLADGAVRQPGRISDLFSSLSNAEHFRDLAFIGYYNGDTGLAQGFAEAAEAIFSAWQEPARSNDRPLPPIAYNYRLALELALKQAIRQAASCRRAPVRSAKKCSAGMRMKMVPGSPRLRPAG